MVYDDVVVGVDGSPAGFTALEEALRLCRPAAKVVGVTVVDSTPAPRAAWAGPRIVEHLDEEAEATRRKAAERLGEDPHRETAVRHGRVAETLFAAVEERGAELLAVGDHGGRRAVGLLMGSVATRTLREMPCSVLIARGVTPSQRFPSRIVAGVDGSAGAEDAYRRARALADAVGASFAAVVAAEGPSVDLAAVRRLAPDVRPLPGAPTDALVAASRDADLLVVGSRGLTGIRALGSVSEHVGHEASSSILVVREAG
jgi:nucleotide-binding universal stress UspA family protein